MGTRMQLERLIRILRILKARRYPDAAELGEACAASRRTIYRDLVTLADAGFLIHYCPEHEGYELVSSVPAEQAVLSREEVVAILVMMACSGSSGDWPAAGFHDQAESALDKLMAGLPESSRAEVAALRTVLRRRGCEGAPGSVDQPVYHALLESILRQVQVRITYRVFPCDAPVQTRFQPYAVERGTSGWMVEGRSSVERGVIRIPVGSIERIELTEDRVVRPPRYGAGVGEGREPEEGAGRGMARGA